MVQRIFRQAHAEKDPVGEYDGDGHEALPGHVGFDVIRSWANDWRWNLRSQWYVSAHFHVSECRFPKYEKN